jgi:hypothetical protein
MSEERGHTFDEHMALIFFSNNKKDAGWMMASFQVAYYQLQQPHVNTMSKNHRANA